MSRNPITAGSTSQLGSPEVVGECQKRPLVRHLQNICMRVTQSTFCSSACGDWARVGKTVDGCFDPKHLSSPSKRAGGQAISHAHGSWQEIRLFPIFEFDFEAYFGATPLA